MFGLDWRTLFPEIKNYINDRETRFELLSKLQLSTVNPGVLNCVDNLDPRELCRLYRRYAVRIHDYGNPTIHFNIPLLDITVAARDDNVLFERIQPDAASLLLPTPTRTTRVILFPQTRYAFLEDDVSL